MNKRLRTFLIGTVITLSLFFTYEYVDSKNEYIKESPVTVEVVNLISGNTQGRHGGSLEFIGVFKTQEGIYFDQHMSPSTYTQLHVGDKVTLNLSPRDIQSNGRLELGWVLGMALLMVSIVGSGIFTLVWTIFYDWIHDED